MVSLKLTDEIEKNWRFYKQTNKVKKQASKKCDRQGNRLPIQCNPMQSNVIQCNPMQSNAIQCNPMQSNAIKCNPMQSNAI